MKKIILLLAFVSILYSCSNGGNSSSSSNNNPPVTATPVTDIDGNSYNTVVIGTQVWMQKNLDVTHYRNGDVIPQVTDATQWANLTTGAWCYYNNDPANASYGKLYNAYAVHDPRGLAPQGCHVPTQNECNSLITYCNTLGGNYGTWGKLKETGFTHWGDPNYSLNETGFTALGGGSRHISGEGSNMSSSFWDLKVISHMWTSTPFPGSLLSTQTFIIQYGAVNTGVAYKNPYGKSVRCIKD
jgi:uncharacterized protein (TIGR02145 family)